MDILKKLILGLSLLIALPSIQAADFLKSKAGKATVFIASSALLYRVFSYYFNSAKKLNVASISVQSKDAVTASPPLILAGSPFVSERTGMVQAIQVDLKRAILEEINAGCSKEDILSKYRDIFVRYGLDFEKLKTEAAQLKQKIENESEAHVQVESSKKIPAPIKGTILSRKNDPKLAKLDGEKLKQTLRDQFPDYAKNYANAFEDLIK